MERSEATHVAVGATFLAVGGVILSILIPLTAAAKKHPWGAVWFVVPASVAGLCALLGLYILTAVYRGWPLPQTSAEREAARVLDVDSIDVVSVYTTPETQVLFRVGLINRSRGDVTNASINLLVPDFVRDICRCDEGGGKIREGGTVAMTDESVQQDEDGNPIKSRYWRNHGYVFSGRTAAPMYFRASLPSARPFRIEFRVVSADLPLGYTASADLVPTLDVQT